MTDLVSTKSHLPPLELAIQVAREAGDIARTHFHQVKKVEFKGRKDIVTDVDFLIEKALVARLREEFPGHSIITEESQGYRGESDFTWVIDPLDGTRNFAMGIPFFCCSIALTSGEDILVAALYDPLRDELFHAEKGKGAYLNSSPISVSRRTSLGQALVGLDLGYHDGRAKRALELVCQLWPGMQAVRIMGSAALGLAYAACGRLDIYFHHFLYPWDLAGGILLAQEAGGTVTDREGNPASMNKEGIIASNAAIHADFLRLTQGFDWRGEG